MALPFVKKVHHYILNGTMTDISTASSIFIAVPFRGRVMAGWVTIAGAITGADSLLTGKINGTAITGFTGTAANSGSAAGSVFTMVTPMGANDVVNGDVIELISDGASSTAAVAQWTLIIHAY